MRWKKAGNGTYRKLYSSYTLAFIIAALIVFSYFYSFGKSTVMAEDDGLYQHYNAFIYLGVWCRKIIKNLIFNHKLVIPLWEWGLGYGADIITTLGYYTFGDVFALISVITPEKYGEIGYTAAILLRFYAAGFAFCAFAKKMGCRGWSTVCASVMYTFCSYAIFSGVRHPYFILPMIYLPLVWLGCEKMIRGESPFLYILAVFLAAFSNFYFFYMIVLLTVLYVAVRLLSEKPYRNVKVLGKYLLQFTGYGVLGVAMASVVFLPNACNFLFDNTRISSVYTFNPFYSLYEYVSLPGSAIGPHQAVPWAYIGMSPLAYLGAGACFLQKKEDRWAKWYLAAEVLFLLFPAAGHILNGIGYVCNRWVFAWAFIVAFMFAKFFPVLPELAIKKKVILSAGCILYTAFCLFMEKNKYFEYVLAGVILLLASMVLVWLANDTGVWKAGKFKLQKALVFHSVTFLLAITCVFVQAEERFVGMGYIHGFVKSGQVNKKLNGEYKFVSKSVKDNSFYRIDSSNRKNYKVSCGQSAISYDWSLINPNINRFVQYNNAYKKTTYSNKGLCSRAYLLPLAGAKYFVTSKDKDVVPYGYKCIKRTSGNDKIRIYKAEDSLPMGYVYDKGISLEEYEKMTITERQQAMLQGAVIAERDKTVKLKRCVPAYEDVGIPYKVICSGNVEYDGHRLFVKSKKASIVLSLASPVEGELYVEFSGMDFQNTLPHDLQGAGKKEKLQSLLPETSTLLKASCNGVETEMHHFTNYDKYALGRKDYLLNLGYTKEKRRKIKITFSEKGVYTFDSMKVICQHMNHYKDWIKTLQKDVLQNLQITPNHMKGTINVEKNGLLCLSVPYSKGWNAYVDGKKTDLLCTNIMLSGIMLESGFHSIELVYRTPYLVTGFVISILGVVLTALLLVFRHYRKRRYD